MRISVRRMNEIPQNGGLDQPAGKGLSRFAVKWFLLSLLFASALASLGFGIPFGVFPAAAAFGNTPPFSMAGLVVGSVIGGGIAIWRVVKHRVFWAVPAATLGAVGGATFAYFIGGLYVAVWAIQVWVALQP